MSIIRHGFLSLLLIASAGCSFLPSSGPASGSIQAGDDDIALGGYAVIDLTPGVVSALKARPDPSLTSLSQYQPRPRQSSASGTPFGLLFGRPPVIFHDRCE